MSLSGGLSGVHNTGGRPRMSDATKARLVMVGAALAAATITYLVTPADWSSGARAVVSAAVLVSVYLILEFLPRPARWLVGVLAMYCVQFLFTGLETWARKHHDRFGDDTLWNWVTDQILV